MRTSEIIGYLKSEGYDACCERLKSKKIYKKSK